MLLVPNADVVKRIRHRKRYVSCFIALNEIGQVVLSVLCEKSESYAELKPILMKMVQRLTVCPFRKHF